MPSESRSIGAGSPQIKTPADKDVILCHATAVKVEVSPDDAVICITVKGVAGNPLSPCVQRRGTNGVYAGNIDFGVLPEGDAVLWVCYARDGANCSSGMGACSTVPVKVECKVNQ